MKQYVAEWMSTYACVLYAFCFVFGTPFAVVYLLSSNVFGLRLFQMGLCSREIGGYNYYLTLVHSIPMLFMHALYIYVLQEVNWVVLSALLSSVLAVLIVARIALLQCSKEKKKQKVSWNQNGMSECVREGESLR